MLVVQFTTNQNEKASDISETKQIRSYSLQYCDNTDNGAAHDVAIRKRCRAAGLAFR